jgi:hypothetical protein
LTSTLEKVQTLRPGEFPIMETHKLVFDSITETQAAQWLGISMEALHRLLDEHIFNNGTPRPAVVHFTQSDLLLLSYWCDKPRSSKVLSMPRRRC